MQNNLNDNIERERNFCKKELNLLYSTEFKPLQLFMNEYFASHSVPTLNDLNLLLEQNLNKIKDEFKYYVCNSISCFFIRCSYKFLPINPVDAAINTLIPIFSPTLSYVIYHILFILKYSKNFKFVISKNKN